jgi:PAS domain S-box-containing protein
MDTQAVQTAQSKFENVDAIVNIFSMSFVWSTEEFANHLGYTSDELTQMSIRELMPTKATESMRFLSQLLTNKTTPDDERHFVHKDGTKLIGKALVKAFTHDREPHLAIIGASFKKNETQ